MNQRLKGRRIAALAARVLEQMAARPATFHGALPLLSAGERRQVLEEWNGVGEGAAVEGTLVGWLRRQAERAPQRVAVVIEEGDISKVQYLRKWPRISTSTPFSR